MKRIVLLGLVLVMLGCAGAGAETVMTSFYPVYLFTRNLTEGIEGLTVRNLAAPGTGCLHDYQLQMADMKALADADLFLINGAGMESYLSMVTDAFPELPVYSASEGIELLSAADSAVLFQGDDEPNAHIWLDAKKAAQMADNLASALKQTYPDRAEAISANQAAFTARLLALDEQLREGLADLPRRDIVTFHEAFPYFAQAYGLQVVAVVNREPGDALSPAQIGQLANLVVQLGLPPLFVEPQYDDLAARTLAQETGAPVYTLDPCVTGPDDPPLDYYEQVMVKNMETLQEALSQ